MAEWRFLRGWSESELRDRLTRAQALGRNFSEPPEQIKKESGWRTYSHEVIVAKEGVNPSLSNGPFQKAVHAVASMQYFDPSIVETHYDPTDPLLGRTVLFEIKTLGLHCLCPVRISAVRDEQGTTEAVYGFRYDTLSGHIEKRLQWVTLRKSLATGEIRFGLQGTWRSEPFPNDWSKIGSRFLVGLYQLAWQREAAILLREATGESKDALYKRATALGAVAGMRSMLAPMFAARKAGWTRAEQRLKIAAAGELLADKTPWIPARIKPMSLVARVFGGALGGVALSQGLQASMSKKVLASLLGAASAVVVTFAMHRVRQFATQRLCLPDAVTAVAEDGLAIATGHRATL